MAYYILKSYKLKNTPFEIFSALRAGKNCFFLDSSLDLSPMGRFSFLGIEPFEVLSLKGAQPFGKLRDTLNKYKLSVPGTAIPFLGGAVGYIGYDTGFLLEEKAKGKNPGGIGIPDSLFGFYNTAVIIDNFKKRLHIFASGFPEKGYSQGKLLCESNFKKINRLLSSPSGKKEISSKNIRLPKDLKLHSNFTKQEYISAVKKAKEYIRRGDIYQVNLSQKFHAQTDLSAFKIYERLRKINPSSFSAYFDAGDFQILSSSPERFLQLRGDTVSTRPMKGTRPRSKNRAEDRKLKSALLNSGKDKAELTMIVDLERNDLGRVCSYGSIKVKALRELEEYNTVYQTTATVEGRLYNNKDRISLLRACFPGGSITGCPKIRAMEIIEELEPDSRDIYTGCLGYLSFSGDMDFNILIRTILKKKNNLYFGAGGGIVIDSRPEDEYKETLVKARGMFEAINERGSFFKR
jgi:para-aminobenzoate synthetase component 1